MSTYAVLGEVSIEKKLLLLKFNLFDHFIKGTFIHCKVLRKKWDKRKKRQKACKIKIL